MKRPTTLIASLALGAVLLTGCSGGTDAYCDDLKQTEKDFSDFDAGDFENFDNFIDRARDLADDAPPEVEEEWGVLVDALNGFVGALEGAGLEMEDLDALNSGEVPEGVDIEKLTEAAGEIQALGSEEVEEATDKIAEHAKDECGVELDQ